MTVLAIDPGTTKSAWLDFRAGVPMAFGMPMNELLLVDLRSIGGNGYDAVVIEEVTSYGMAVGREVFETVYWSGQFAEAAHPIPVVRIPRREVKLHLCGTLKANDANIRAAVLDVYGGREQAVGNKKAPGPLYGISKDVWSALALALTYEATHHSHSTGERT